MWEALRIWLVVRLLLLACAFCGVACVPREVDIDAFASSAQVLAERTAFNVTCSTGCALAPLFERTLHHYDVLDRVFVVGAAASAQSPELSFLLTHLLL
jgi:hypothetical protein